MNLFESLKDRFLTSDKKIKNPSSKLNISDQEQDLSNEMPVGFFDESSDINYLDSSKGFQEQNRLIENYRKIALRPEVSYAVNEIIDECIFSPGEKNAIILDFADDDIPINLKEQLLEEFKNVNQLLNTKKNLYSLFLTFYIDGQLNLHCSYDEDNIKKGINKLKIMSPFNLIYNGKESVWEYRDGFYNKGMANNNHNIMVNRKQSENKFKPEEVIRIDSGIYSGNLILSNLHKAIKPSNMLQTLEDMLIPLRFSRSVSRRIFNVDVSKLNSKKAEEVMRKNESRFKYKKFYDLESGQISNQQHIMSLMEDYWFANRGGEKGTTVDMLDESGNLGELGDIIYLKRKLYDSLNLPSSRIDSDDKNDREFDFSTTSVSREEIRLFNFTNRLREQFLELFYELLKRNSILKPEINLKEEEWEKVEKSLIIKFSSENLFYEKMARESLVEQMNLFNDLEFLIGKYFSHQFVLKKVLKLSEDEITDLLDEIENEKKDSKFGKLYDSEDEE